MEHTTPTTLWRLRGPQLDEARAVIIPGHRQQTLSVLVNDVLDRVENYDALDDALARAEDVKRTLESDGWREDE